MWKVVGSIVEDRQDIPWLLLPGLIRKIWEVFKNTYLQQYIKKSCNMIVKVECFHCNERSPKCLNKAEPKSGVTSKRQKRSNC